MYLFTKVYFLAIGGDNYDLQNTLLLKFKANQDENNYFIVIY